MLADRVATGADLYHAGKVDILLFSGDGREASYNEPESMKRYALSLGVPESAIVLDYAGLRTYDSCYRARHIFGVEEAILVTQNFHLDRALFTCNLLGVKSDGVFADYQRPWGYSSYSLSYSRTPRDRSDDRRPVGCDPARASDGWRGAAAGSVSTSSSIWDQKRGV
jgi:uncharacterized SAM-binding protein YcdF (DUF218 family)